MAAVKRKLFKNPFAKQPKAQTVPDEPWRVYKDLKEGWKKEHYKKLLGRIESRTEEVLALSDVKSKTVNIMMLGYVQSGKSSTINSIFSILDDKISNRAKAGESSASFTQSYLSYKGEKELKRVVLFDVMGIELGQNLGLQNHDIKQCIKGGVKEGHEFNPYSPISKDKGDNCVETSPQQTEIHCVMYCVDAETIFEEIVPGFEQKMQDVESELKVAVQDRIVLVTKIDAICNKTKADITKIYHSKSIEKVVEKAASVFRVNKNHVFPIKNYTDEMETCENKNIPLLQALEKAIDFGTDYLRDKADKARRCSSKIEQQTEI